VYTVNRCCIHWLHGWVIWQLLTALPAVWHLKDLCMLNSALDIENFSSKQPSWTSFWKWPFSNDQKKGDFYYVKTVVKAYYLTPERLVYVKYCLYYINILYKYVKNFSSLQPSWKWPFSNGKKKGDSYYVQTGVKAYGLTPERLEYVKNCLRYREF